MWAQLIKLSVTCSRNLNSVIHYSNHICKQNLSYCVVTWGNKPVIAHPRTVQSTSRRYRHNIFPSLEDADELIASQERDNTKEHRSSQSQRLDTYSSKWEKPRSSNFSKAAFTSKSEWKETSDAVDEDLGNFENFDISEKTISKLKASGINFLFPSQTSTYNSILNGKDVIVQARTGSGKTLSYAVPLIERILKASDNSRIRTPRLLVLTPTRELARQVADVITSLSANIKVASVYGGTSIVPQEKLLRGGVDVIVGTPGRISDFLERKTLSLKGLQHVVLDEVDRMLDMGFAQAVDDILSHRYVYGKPDQNPQTLLFSATVPAWVQQTAQKYLQHDIVKIDLVGKGNTRTSTSVQHLAVQCTPENRAKVIAETLQVYSGAHGRAIVFCAMKREADKFATSSDLRIETHVLHGDIPQDKREMVLKGFRDGRYQCLIATDVAARGLDIPEVDLVIQCSPPKDVDSYIHRSGRTGRAGRSGVSIVVFTPFERRDLYIVEKTALSSTTRVVFSPGRMAQVDLFQCVEGIKFKLISPPTPETSAAAATEDAVKSLGQVSQSVMNRFMSIAETVAAKHGSTNALAAAIAVMSGFGQPKSLLTAKTGFSTYVYQSAGQLDKVETALQSLQLPDTIKEKIVSTRLCADHKGCVFDLPSEYDDVVAKQWSDANAETLSIATHLPALETSPFLKDSRTGMPFDRRSYNSDSRYKHGVNGQYNRSKSFQSHGYGDKISSYRSKRPNFRSLSEEE